MNIRTFKGEMPRLEEGVYVDPKAVVIGKVHLGKDVSVWPMAVIRGDVNTIEVGEGSNIQDAAILHVTHDGPYTAGGEPLIIGKGVTIGHQVVLHGCHIEDYCLIGMGALVMDRVYIEDHVMVGAGSVIPPGKKLESGYLYLGNPAKKLRKLTEKEREQLEDSSAHYIRLKNNYLDP